MNENENFFFVYVNCDWRASSRNVYNWDGKLWKLLGQNSYNWTVIYVIIILQSSSFLFLHFFRFRLIHSTPKSLNLQIFFDDDDECYDDDV